MQSAIATSTATPKAAVAVLYTAFAHVWLLLVAIQLLGWTTTTTALPTAPLHSSNGFGFGGSAMANDPAIGNVQLGAAGCVIA